MMLSDFKKRVFTATVLFFLVFLIIKYDFFLIYSLIVLGVLSILEFIKLLKKIKLVKYFYYIFNLFFIIYIFSFCFTFYYFSFFPHLKIFLYSFLFTCISSDIGGFIFGKIFKGPKLSKLSPNKTIAGAVGSIILSCITLKIILFYLTKKLSIEILLIAIIISIACQIGDLFFSFLKRRAKIKDTGNIFPGHGGVLDRLDGIFLGLPFGFLSLIIFLK